ncbi:pyridoxamine 5'-phosphate oxidase family protein [Gordonia sp. SID5947]|uniref:pyridoxamine 5'-phosphate oxidase family protein n=1 Tax=Gordonia sp. SID5947 TaxID=2690315 RepID=UPI00136A6D9A|nr:pyridoxamine 5'-phosphate oxidase family protein [Gordonia sp. SID5947]MYR06183.1 pyridoxamine 5'-phosphate oxidase family protein [Gordonia sp. SID5947]
MVENVVQVLTDDEAWELLATVELGRIAVSVNGQPDIFPVNFHAGEGRIVFRTGEGTKLSEIAVNENVAFEADDHTALRGWSIVAKGAARVLVSTHDIAAADELPLRPWTPTVKYNYVVISVDEISGRRFLFGPEPERYPV